MQSAKSESPTGLLKKKQYFISTSYILHLRNIKFSSNVSDILALLGLRINPLLEKMRSTGAELAILRTHAYASVTLYRLYLVSVHMQCTSLCI